MKGIKALCHQVRQAAYEVREGSCSLRSLRLTDCLLEFFSQRMYFKQVGKTYLFECPQCQFRAKISGGVDGGLHCEIQTIICRDCRQLYDVFTRQRRRQDAVDLVKFPGFHQPDIPPVILGASSVQPSAQPRAPLVWRETKLTCPIEADHVVEPWRDPGRCPRCGNFMERNGIPFRAWD